MSTRGLFATLPGEQKVLRQNGGLPVTIPIAKAPLLEGKKGLVIGIANEQSIAWGCAKAFRALGADLAVTYLNDKAKKYVEPLAKELNAPIFMPLDVRISGQMEAVFEQIRQQWGDLDFAVHSIAFSPKEALQGRVIDVGQDGFLTTMDVSCWSFLHMAHLAEPLMKNGGTLFTMTYYGSQMVVENYNIMGVAKAALESAVRYVAAELGPKRIRVHAISPGPLATPRGVRHPRVRRIAGQGESQGAGAQPGQYRRCRHRDGVPGARCRAPDHRRDALH
jgi:enoyl-[acyl-carrier protein] reductase I